MTKLSKMVSIIIISIVLISFLLFKLQYMAIKYFIIIVIISILSKTAHTYITTEKFLGSVPENFLGSVPHNSFGALMQHVEFANQMCSTSDDYPECQKFQMHYDGLRRSFNKLKNKYCRHNPSRCNKLGV